MKRIKMIGNHRKKRGERGAALLSVIALIFACSMIVSGIIATLQMGTYNIIPHVKMQKSMYTDEGVLNRIHWLLVVERSKYPDTDFLNFKYSDYSFDHFLPDGVVHKIDYHGTPVALRLTGTAFAVEDGAFLRHGSRVISEYECGKRSMTQSAAMKIGKALNTDPKKLMV